MKTCPKLIKYNFFILVLLTFSILSGCKKFIEVDAPTTSINQANIYSNNSNAIAAVTSMYTKLSGSYFTLHFSVFPELSSDNLTLYDLNNSYAIQYYQNTLNSSYQGHPIIFWNDLYNYIYSCNSAIEGLSTTSGVSENIKQRLLGECYFLRSFFYFYLVNFYQNIPLVLTTDYSVSSTQPNISADLVYQQIVADLLHAQEMLDNTYLDGSLNQSSTDRIRPNGMTATALLAKVYLYLKNYEMAISESSKVISAASIYNLEPLPSVFLRGSRETIWALQSVSYQTNTKEGEFYIYTSEGPNAQNYTYLSTDFLNQFENGDLRKTEWIGHFKAATEDYPYPLKYKVKNGDPATSTEFSVVFRLAEQYLISAESKIQLGNITGGVEDLNKLRSRSRATPTIEVPNPMPDIKTNITKEEALDLLFKERRIELFTEWGNRWFDLKRSGRIDDIMRIVSPSKGVTWNAYQSIYPLPLNEITANKNLKQNPGYQ